MKIAELNLSLEIADEIATLMNKDALENATKEARSMFDEIEEYAGKRLTLHYLVLGIVHKYKEGPSLVIKVNKP